MPDLPSSDQVDETIKVVHDHADRIFLWNYDRSRGQLVTLYNKAMGSQWNSVTELDWSTEVDPFELVDPTAPFQQLARAARDVDGSPIASWGDKELHQLGVESFKAQLSQFMHGEQGAMMTAAKIVETVPWIDAKYYAATQTMDEARHTEVFAKYLHTKLGEAYPMSPFLEGQITALLEDDRWDIAYLGMQIVIESLALAVRVDAAHDRRAPVAEAVALRHVRRGPARGLRGAQPVRVLRRPVGGRAQGPPGVPDREHLAQQGPPTTPEVWERMGVRVEAVYPAITEAAGRIKVHPFAGFQRAFFSKLVPNVRKLGLLDANDGYLRRHWADSGLLEFEFADDTGSDYESYDAVAADRAAAAGS